MPELKLPKLPDRTPVKLTITLAPDLNRDLAAYAEAYRQAYGTTEPVAELIPFMLEKFLAADRGYAKVRKGQTGGEAGAAPPTACTKERRPRPPSSVPPGGPASGTTS